MSLLFSSYLQTKEDDILTSLLEASLLFSSLDLINLISGEESDIYHVFFTLKTLTITSMVLLERDTNKMIAWHVICLSTSE